MSRDAARALDVLVVEDDEGVARCIREVLQQAGHSPTTVRTLLDARMHLAVARPDVVTLDLDLGADERGLSLLEDIEDLTDQSPCVIVSAYRFARAIADEFGVALVTKPFDIDVLVAAVERAASRGAERTTPSPHGVQGSACCEPSSLPPPFVGAAPGDGLGCYHHAWPGRRARS